MNIKSFKVERWLNTYENDADYEMAETDIKPFTLKELLELGDFENLVEQILNIKLGNNLIILYRLSESYLNIIFSNFL